MIVIDNTEDHTDHTEDDNLVGLIYIAINLVAGWWWLIRDDNLVGYLLIYLSIYLLIWLQVGG